MGFRKISNPLASTVPLMHGFDNYKPGDTIGRDPVVVYDVMKGCHTEMQASVSSPYIT